MFKKPFYINLLFSFLTVLLLSFSFPSPCISLLAWIALVPWLLIISGGNRVGLFSYLIGVLFFVFNISWIGFVTYPGWFLLSFYLAAYFLAFGVVSHYVRRRLRLPFVFTVPFIWVAFEFLRSSSLFGLPWFFIGHSQYLSLYLVQIVDITGVYGVSFLVIVFNAAIADLIEHLLIKRNSNLVANPIILCSGGKSFYCLSIVLPCLLLFLVLVYGYFCLKDYEDLQDGPNVCLVQGNVPQDVKLDPDGKQKEEILMKYINLSLSAKGKDVDLIIWPETMVPGILNMDPEILDRRIDRLSRESIQRLANDTGSSVLVGGTAIDINKKSPLFFNTAFLYNKEGKLVDRYDKLRLVPFGEFIPFASYFPFLARLVPYETSLTKGTRKTIFELNTGQDNRVFKFGVIICYEDAVAPLVREFRKEGVDFMVNITNDAWFCDTSELDQHLAILVFRAIENRVCITRAANTGISSFVAPSGEIYGFLARDGKYREVEGVLCDKIRFANTANTWYTNHGDMFAILCLSITVILFLVSLSRRINERN